jgi:asparagine synthase (glutamine-hydrolysing)
MDGIFGFFDSPEPIIFQQMQHNLSHRIGHKIQQVQTDKISVGYGRFRELHWQHTEETGIATQNDITIAVCGFFTHTAQSQTPQQLIALYQQRGIDALCRLQGSFLIALHDNEHGYLILDGAGQRTLYYSVQNGKLFFAIEPKGLHQMSGFPRRLNPDALVQYLCFSFVPKSNTMLEDLHELPPGHYLQ